MMEATAWEKEKPRSRRLHCDKISYSTHRLGATVCLNLRVQSSLDAWNSLRVKKIRTRLGNLEGVGG